MIPHLHKKKKVEYMLGPPKCHINWVKDILLRAGFDVVNEFCFFTTHVLII
jgi:hypothetical protein